MPRRSGPPHPAGQPRTPAHPGHHTATLTRAPHATQPDEASSRDAHEQTQRAEHAHTDHQHRGAGTAAQPVTPGTARQARPRQARASGGARTTATHHERQRRWQRECVSTVLASDTGSADAATLTSERETSSEDDDSSEATTLSTTPSAEPGNAG